MNTKRLQHYIGLGLRTITDIKFYQDMRKSFHSKEALELTLLTQGA